MNQVNTGFLTESNPVYVLEEDWYDVPNLIQFTYWKKTGMMSPNLIQFTYWKKTGMSPPGGD